jgi:phosphate starvation-inducible protein PhoH
MLHVLHLLFSEDLPPTECFLCSPKQRRDLNGAEHALTNIAGIAFTRFSPADIVRHPIVEHIVRAYEKFRE